MPEQYAKTAGTCMPCRDRGESGSDWLSKKRNALSRKSPKSLTDAFPMN